MQHIYSWATVDSVLLLLNEHVLSWLPTAAWKSVQRVVLCSQWIQPEASDCQQKQKHRLLVHIHMNTEFAKLSLTTVYLLCEPQVCCCAATTDLWPPFHRSKWKVCSVMAVNKAEHCSIGCMFSVCGNVDVHVKARVRVGLGLVEAVKPHRKSWSCTTLTMYWPPLPNHVSIMSCRGGHTSYSPHSLTTQKRYTCIRLLSSSA